MTVQLYVPHRWVTLRAGRETRALLGHAKPGRRFWDVPEGHTYLEVNHVLER